MLVTLLNRCEFVLPILLVVSLVSETVTFHKLVEAPEGETTNFALFFLIKWVIFSPQFLFNS